MTKLDFFPNIHLANKDYDKNICVDQTTSFKLANQKLHFQHNPALRRTPRTAEIPQHFQSQSLILATSNFRSEVHATELAAWVTPLTRTQGASLRSTHHFNGLVWHCGNSSALTMELSQSYAKPSISALACFAVVNTSFTHILQNYLTGTGAIIWLTQCQWCNPEEYVSLDPMKPSRSDSKTTNHNKIKHNKAMSTIIMMLHEGQVFIFHQPLTVCSKA